ncbi:MAG: LacI family DNA-binding transcriptional regulator [Bacteroidota bacterium]
MRNRQVTIKDIAKLLHISPSTVSRALKDHPDINPETKKNVREMAKKMNYKPNKIALQLLQQESNIIGVIIPEIIHHFFSTVISGIENEANKAGYQIMICQSNESYEREVANVQTLLSSHIDGFIMSLAKTTNDYTHLKQIEEVGVPVVFFDRICDCIKADSILVDDYEGAYKATCHLIEQGCKHLVHLAGPQHLTIGKERKNGFLQALRDNGLPQYVHSVQICDTRDQALKIVPQLLQDHPSVDGIFAVNDMTATGAMNAAKELHKRIPRDIAISGFTDSFIATLTDPPLTSVDQKGFLMGQQAARLLLNRISGKSPEGNVKKVLQTELRIRESSKRQ